MSFLGGRLAGKEAAYFFQESKQAVAKLAPKHNHNPLPLLKGEQQQGVPHVDTEAQAADVLPEVLKHSLPPTLFKNDAVSSSSTSSSSSSFSPSKWLLLPSHPNSHSSSASPDAINPLRAYVSLPQVTFGPKRWQLPEAKHMVSASTANELREDKYIMHANPEKLRAAAEGLANVGKAFAVATVIVFGGAALVFGIVASKLDLHNINDVKTKGKDYVEPQMENIKEQFVPLKIWAENMSRKWHFEREEVVKEKPIVKELSKILGAKTSD